MVINRAFGMIWLNAQEVDDNAQLDILRQSALQDGIDIKASVDYAQQSEDSNHHARAIESAIEDALRQHLKYVSRVGSTVYSASQRASHYHFRDGTQSHVVFVDFDSAYNNGIVQKKIDKFVDMILMNCGGE